MTQRLGFGVFLAPHSSYRRASHAPVSSAISSSHGRGSTNCTTTSSGSASIHSAGWETHCVGRKCSWSPRLERTKRIKLGTGVGLESPRTNHSVTTSRSAS